MEEKKRKFIEALRQNYGIITSACEAVEIGRSTFYYWCKNDEKFKEAVEEVTEVQVDFVESKLMQLINANDTTAIIFYLKTKGKKRGYNEKALPVKEAAPVQVPALPTTDDKKERKAIERKVKQKKAYIVKLLKKQGKYTAELTYQVDITAQLLVRADMLGEEMLSEGHKSVSVEYSREGNERVLVNPKEKLYLDVLERGQKALRALGMNTESKERKSDADGLDDFMSRLSEAGK